LENFRESARDWCREGHDYRWRILFLLYGVFLAWKISLRPETFTPIDFLDLGIHELGHVLFMPFGEWIGVLGGSLTQILAPIYGIWQFLRQRDFFAASFAIAWLGESLGNLSVYIGDARSQELPLANLFGGDPIHDWNYLLSSVNRLGMDTKYALLVRGLGLACVLAFLWTGTWMLWQMYCHGEEEKKVG